MTREKAIKRLEDTFEAWDGWAKKCPEDAPARLLNEALGMAIAALREQDKVVESDQFKWISVEDRLPVAYITVLVCRKHFERTEPTVCTDHLAVTALGKRVWAQDAKNWKSTVTHWMPLPEPPEVEV